MRIGLKDGAGTRRWFYRWPPTRSRPLCVTRPTATTWSAAA